MDRKNRPHGREKNITSGGGDVHKRGDGLNLGGPLGDAGGYSERREQNESPPSPGTQPQNRQGQQRGSAGGSLGSMLLVGLLSNLLSGRGGRRGSLGKLIVLGVVLFVGYMMFQSCMANMDGLAELPAQQAGLSQTGELPHESDWSHGSYGTGPNAYLDDANDVGSGVLNTAVAPEARAKYTTLTGAGQDVATVMIYMCGTDLESKSGMASSDLQEMINAQISDKVNVIVQTGGCERWRNSVVSSKTNQIYKLTSQGLTLLEDNLGLRSMTDPDTLSKFIGYCTQSFPADRYQLVLWDHGGGSQGGYGYDQNFPQSTMTLDKLNTALQNSGCRFDFIGFDACLMATLETAMVLEQYADYLVASEETEPGYGWYYTNWLTALSQNTSISTLELGKVIVDDFINVSRRQAPQDKTTLSLIDLAELKGTVPGAFNDFASSTTELINTDQYKIVANARGQAREFAPSTGINQVDLIDLAENMQTPQGAALASALRGCVKYNLTAPSMTDSYGVSIYFPYGGLQKLDSMLSTYNKIGLDSAYGRCIQSFANVQAGGQMLNGGGNSPLDSLLGSLLGSQAGAAPSNSGAGAGLGDLLGLLGGAQQSASAAGASSTQSIIDLLGGGLDSGSFSGLSGISAENAGWMDRAMILDNAEYYANNRFDTSHLTITPKNGGKVLSMPDEQWDLITDVQLNVFLDDGEGFIDLGLDNTFDFDEDGDLLLAYDGTWLALDGQVVSYYMISEQRQGEDYTITGRVPAMLNEQLVDIILVFTDEQPNGVVAGARINYGGSTDAQAKGLITIEEGDRLDFLCDYYSYDEQFQNNYYLGEQLTVSGELTVSNVSVGEAQCKATYRLRDIYQNAYWTPVI